MNTRLIMHSKNLPCRKKQAGVVLFVSLIFILMITMLAVTSIQSTTVTERIAGNSRDKSVAFQAAETALRDAESFLEPLSVSPATDALFNNRNGLYDSRADTNVHWNTVNGGYRTYTGLPNVNAQPQYMIELLPEELFAEESLVSGKPVESLYRYYRVTSLGTGSSDSSIVMLQSIYRDE